MASLTFLLKEKFRVINSEFMHLKTNKRTIKQMKTKTMDGIIWWQSRLKKVLRKSFLLLTCLLSCTAGEFIYSVNRCRGCCHSCFLLCYQNPASSGFQHILNSVGLQCQTGTAETPALLTKQILDSQFFSVRRVTVRKPNLSCKPI